ncbi:MAG TPA: spermidine/putrescine ABC transporter substrate-binding protein [Bacillota bacterium]|nr:spermidine/putrescine ABC transporter substrate-binding protein [Bacillota bacterium]HOH09738.1 spermidine/putrescine ABC transporter substrate-binding protein [Bacillota bacterium]HOY88464.1 spermidine/putrescine ABC transporter substrate-binding protein [Bacillota bacterium]HPI00625.1 spermidine/putrescine ABC transporter substrate-binding protein [Bacillota bacterium]HPM63047.1 spermidine/putrescine ABC transporter substrate-binding protein [Bacillota bacterium]
MRSRYLIILLVIILVLAALFAAYKLGYFGKKATLSVYNFGEYIDPSVLEEFEKKYDIKVVYETYSTNEEMLAKMKAGGNAYDVIFPSAYMLEVLIAEGMLAPLDHDNIPNYAYVDPMFKGLSCDPEDKYSVPYFWGTVGILYNSNLVDDVVDSWWALHNLKYYGKVIMFDSMRDTIGLTLKMLGYSMNSVNPDEINQAKDILIRQKPMVRSYEIDAYKDSLLSGDAVMSMAWSGDAFMIMMDHPEFKYVIPKEGTGVWVDYMAIPTDSKNKEYAQKFIDFMLRPDIGLKNTLAVGYSTPNDKVKQLLPQEIKDNKAAYPDGNVFEGSEFGKDLKEATELYDQAWTEIKSK